MTTVLISLPGQPIPKGRPKFASINGRAIAYTPKKTRDYEARLTQEARKAMAGRPLLTGALELTVWAYIGVPKSWSKAKKERALQGSLRPVTRPDWDNYAKITDALNCVIWADDNQIVTGTVHKFYTNNPRLQVMVQEI